MLDGWTYADIIKLHNHAAEMTDYQIKVCVLRKTGINKDDDIYVGNKCKADYGDIRFTAANGTYELAYWMESYDSESALFWVKVPTIAQGTTIIQMQYGNPSATTTGNGTNTFEFFDNFSGTTLNTSKWTSVGNVVVNNGVTVTAAPGDESSIVTNTSWAAPYIMACKSRSETVSGYHNNDILLHLNGTSYYANRYKLAMWSESDRIVTLYEILGGTQTELINTPHGWEEDVDYIHEIETSSSGFTRTIMDENRIPWVIHPITDTSRTSGNIMFRSYSYGSTTFRFHVDWIYIRKYTRYVPTKSYPRPLSEYRYRKSHSVTTPAATTLQTIRLILHSGRGTDSGEHVYLNGKCREDYDDIRVVLSDGSTVVPYFIEKYPTYAAMYATIPTLDSSSSIYLYYGNPLATNESDPFNVFEFFDDFCYTTVDASFTAKWNSADTSVISFPTPSVITMGYWASSYSKWILSTKNAYGNNKAGMWKIYLGNFQDASRGGYIIADANWAQMAPYYYLDGSYVNHVTLACAPGGNWGTSVNCGIVDAGWHTLEVLRNYPSWIRGTVDHVSSNQMTTYLPSANTPWVYNKRGNYPNELIDWVAIRNIDATMVHGSWGTESLMVNILSGFNYKRYQTITAQTDVNNLQMKIRVYKGSGTNTPTDVYLNGKCRDDFKDVVFTNKMLTVLPHWISNYVSGNYADIWFKLDLINKSSAIYVFYDDSDAQYLEDPFSVFPFFEGFENTRVFDRTKWNSSDAAYSHGTRSISNSVLRIANTLYTSVYNIISGRTDTNSTSLITGFRIKVNQADALDSGIRAGIKANTLAIGAKIGIRKNTSLFIQPVNESVEWGTEISGASIDTWYTLETRHDNTNFIYKLDNGSWNTWAISPAGAHLAISVYNGTTGGVEADVDWVYQRKYNTISIQGEPWSSELLNQDPAFIANETIYLQNPSTSNLAIFIASELINITEAATRMIHTKVINEIIYVSDSATGFLAYVLSEIVRFYDQSIGAYICNERINLHNGGDPICQGHDEYGIGHARKRIDEYGNYIMRGLKATGAYIRKAITWKTNTECEVVEQVAICEEIVYIYSEAEEQE